MKGSLEVNLLDRVEKLEEDFTKSATIIWVLSRQLEKLGIHFGFWARLWKSPLLRYLMFFKWLISFVLYILIIVYWNVFWGWKKKDFSLRRVRQECTMTKDLEFMENVAIQSCHESWIVFMAYYSYLVLIDAKVGTDLILELILRL